MPRYRYSGPVYEFDQCITSKWTAETIAVSEAKAKNNLTYRYKKEHCLPANSSITLPNKVRLVKE